MAAVKEGVDEVDCVAGCVSTDSNMKRSMAGGDLCVDVRTTREQWGKKQWKIILAIRPRSCVM